jgi:cell division protein FtsB
MKLKIIILLIMVLSCATAYGLILTDKATEDIAQLQKGIGNIHKDYVSYEALQPALDDLAQYEDVTDRLVQIIRENENLRQENLDLKTQIKEFGWLKEANKNIK